jgi:hypothetical protein
MGKIIPFDAARPFNRETAMERIRRMWAEGNYIPCAYAEDRMLERGFTDADIEHLITITGYVSGHRKVDGIWSTKSRENRSTGGVWPQSSSSRATS